MSAGANGCDEVGSQYEAEPSVQLRAMTSVYAIDTCLAPIGLAVAFAAQSSPWGVLLALPLIALLSVFARERRVRIDHELELRDAYRGPHSCWATWSRQTTPTPAFTAATSSS